MSTEDPVDILAQGPPPLMRLHNFPNLFALRIIWDPFFLAFFPTLLGFSRLALSMDIFSEGCSYFRTTSSTRLMLRAVEVVRNNGAYHVRSFRVVVNKTKTTEQIDEDPAMNPGMDS